MQEVETTPTPPPAPAAPPVVLSIAGSDCSAGAGAQADLKTFSAAGVYGLTALTCVVAEVPGRVAAIQPVDLEIVRKQIELSFASFPVAAIKTGMLHSRAVIEIVAEMCAARCAPRPPGTVGAGLDRIPLVVDPVMIASSGDTLLEASAIQAYTQKLFPLAALLTPNLDEGSALLGRKLSSLLAMRLGGRELAERFGVPVLLKGGHLGGDTATDLLIYPDGRTVEYEMPFTRGVSTHGTGCTLSAAITACLGMGVELEEAVSLAKEFVSTAVLNYFRWPRQDGSTDALNHFALPA